MQGIFVGTFLIGLREGLEATLIVSIVAAFLKRNGRSVRPMMAGVALAVAISIAVGIALNLLSETLPQRQQEMLETVIGAIAVVFVTTMIIWMNQHAAKMKGELEREAQQAINAGSSLALATMAFLAVLKEGFETSVFILAAAQASGTGRGWALAGALVGIAVAIGIGIGIYYGGLKLNLARFFRLTGVFLVLIAAGLVMSALRTAHEAGWVTIGQQQLFDFSSWMPPSSFTGALITGMFGIPHDPRLIEVLGWALYAVPVLVVFLWPARLAAEPAARRRVLWGIAALLAAAAVALVVLVPATGPAPGPTRTVTSADGHQATVTLHGSGDTRQLTVTAGQPDVTLQAAGTQSLDGLTVDVWQAKAPADPGVTQPTVTLGELADLGGGRLPVGLAVGRTPGPFDAQWSATTAYNVLTQGDSLIRAEASTTRIATLRGGGLAGTKTVSVGTVTGGDWASSEADDQAVATHVAQVPQQRAERMLWTVWLPLVLAVGAAYLVFAGWRTTRSSVGNERNEQQHGEAPNRNPTAVP